MEIASPMILSGNHFLAALFGLETHACVHVDVCLFSLEKQANNELVTGMGP